MLEESDWIIDGDERNRPLLVLAHGAGAGPDSPFLARISALIAENGIAVARFPFAYMKRARAEGRRLPPPRTERLMKEFREALSYWQGRTPLFIGGKSMGGRIASMLADELYAEGSITGLVCLGYPFHPPGRPQQLRIDHLQRLQTPALICQGDRDPFGSRKEVEAYALSPAIRIFWAPDGDHDLKPRVKSGETWANNMAMAARAIADFIRQHAA